MKNKILPILILFVSLACRADDGARFKALSMIESGDCDSCVGASGEVSRFQILPSVWRQYTKLPLSSATNTFTAENVARAIMRDRCTHFQNFKGRSSNILFYMLWHRPAVLFTFRQPTPVECDRAERFANLCQKYAKSFTVNQNH